MTSIAPVDLSGWHAETMPRDTWSYSGHNVPTWTTSGANNDNVKTSGNSAPAVYCSPDGLYGNIFEGSVTVPSGTGDDDFFGWAIGFKPGDFTNADAEYYLIDWKMNDQDGVPSGGVCGEPVVLSKKGMALSKVTGTPADPDFFMHKNYPCTNGGVEELKRANTLGSTGWQKAVVYDFKLEATDAGATLSIGGTEELTIDGPIEGKFCFYTFSQDAPTFNSIKRTTFLCTKEPTSGPTPVPTSGPTSKPTTVEMRGTNGSDFGDVPTDPPADSPSDAPSPPDTPISDAGSKGDPHFKTFVGEHFEFHGQCDLVLARDPEFADGLGLDVQIRTKLVRYWSYIKRAAIRIGHDIIEVEGTIEEPEYWFNFVHQGEVKTLGGFPVTIKDTKTKNRKQTYEIDLSSKYPGQKIVIGTLKEFVKVDFIDASEDAFGNVVGMLGEFKTGKTLARDGKTEIHDFNELGNEWQVIPEDHMLFNDVSDPQFPKKCILPEDPRGERRRRLEESSISLAEAEKACSALSDPLDIKDCVYDIIATQDLDMVGAF